MNFSTPYYLIDESRMLPNMEKIRYIKETSGAKSVLALKCFSSWCAFSFMKRYLSGTTSSSLYEARLGYETFGSENHGYSVAFNDDEFSEVTQYCNKIIFNSLTQLDRFKDKATCSLGLRVNPQVGRSHYALSDTVGRYSRLGVKAKQLPPNIHETIDGMMFHMNCENDDFTDFDSQLSSIENKFSSWLHQLTWISLGGGIAFTKKDYPLDQFCQRLKELARKYSLQVYLEPGEAAVTQSTSLVVKVLDIVDNEIPTLIVDAGVETHALDVLVYKFTPALEDAQIIENEALEDAIQHNTDPDKPIYRVAGRTCLAGDIFGNYRFNRQIKIGDTLIFPDMAGYTMVKKNFFNGLAMPSIYHKSIDGKTQLAQQSNYDDFRRSLS